MKIQLFYFIPGATIESLIKELNKYDALMQYWDEFQTFLATFGMYKGSSSAGFYRGQILTIYNGKNFSHMVLAYEFVIQQPRYSK